MCEKHSVGNGWEVVDDICRCIDSAMSFHESIEEPRWFVWLCHALGRRTPKEVVMGELGYFQMVILHAIRENSL